MALSWPFKDPDEILDYDIDWSSRLDPGDTITSSTWTIVGSVVRNSSSFSTTATKIWLHGGTIGDVCVVTNEVTTSGGRTMDQSVVLKIKSK